MKRILFTLTVLLAVAGGIAITSAAHADDDRGGANCPTRGC